MANLFDVFNEGKSVEHTEGGKLESGETPVTISGLKPSTTYDKIQVAYAGQDKKTDVPSFTTAKPAPVLMKSFKIDNLEPAGKVGESAKLTLSDITPADTTNKGVDIWVDDPEVATVLSNEGDTFTISFSKEGTTGIHWLAKDGGGAKADGTVTVTAKTAESEAQSEATSSDAPADE